ncbi:MAG: HNH endonuclease [Hydrogenophaga sp.]|nr:HNH endonuclease [Hydrogenophaga sp.]
MVPQVLQLDIQGTPQAWITPEQAALHLSTDDVAWAIGESRPLAVLRGGINALLQRQSVLAIPPIIALRGQARVNLFDVEPTVTRRKLFIRDRFTCAYCGDLQDPRKLQAEHIHPESRGGQYSWRNLCASCPACNARKKDRTPEEAGMPLLFVPYVPSRYEDFLLQGRNVRADVHEWLAARLPSHSRLH